MLFFAGARSFTSPRLRGEVGAKRRVRGSLRGSSSHRICGSSPSPQPSPRKNGERGKGDRPKSRATVSICDAFFSALKLRNDSRTNRGRIADSPSLPVTFTQHVAGAVPGAH
ncbi:hypothetical protein C2U70_00525 [Bradyrhizobium guangdongense]|nr:hypothetical protein C2U70_00525 [Bradyrhizobium guangdongense]